MDKLKSKTGPWSSGVTDPTRKAGRQDPGNGMTMRVEVGSEQRVRSVVLADKYFTGNFSNNQSLLTSSACDYKINLPSF